MYFNPFIFLILLTSAYALLPALGFGLFPEYFSYSNSVQNWIVLVAFVLTMFFAAFSANRVRAVSHGKLSGSCTRKLQEKWDSKNNETRAFVFLLTTSAAIFLIFLLIIFISGMLSAEFSPHDFRMAVSASGNLPIIAAYNIFSLLTLVVTSLTIFSLQKAYKRNAFKSLIFFQVALLVLNGQRSLIMLAVFSYLFSESRTEKGRSKKHMLAVFFLGVAIIVALGVFRQGEEFNFLALMWQISVRFDLFYPQFFNFLDTYNTLGDIGYGYFHLTLPLQVFPAGLFQVKPITFLHYVNRDLMSIQDGTGNDFTAYAEFIYNYGVFLGLYFYGIYAFVLSLFIQTAYRNAHRSPLYFSIYFPLLLVYVSMVLLTGLSNQAHIFAFGGILISAAYCKLFIVFTSKSSKLFFSRNDQLR